ncbi:MAG: LysM peptidoglycan-binding domain-containing protein [Chloroflexi bacterium]|nr:LysM peptidoglycan-binding domain-containing protein [Chloroflexota bacterium]
MNLRQLAVFLGLNVIVSVAVTLIVLNVWDAGRAAPRVVPTPIATSPNVPAGAGGSLVPTAVPLTIAAPAASPTVAARASQYTVKEGDTLSSLARDFDLSVNQLLAANNLTNGDLLSIGQRLIIPGADGSLPVPTPTPIRPRPAITATEVIALGDAFVTIREINNGGTFSQEQVVLTNIGAKVNLVGWTLADGEGHKFTFPDLTLLSNAEVKVHTGSGVNLATDLYWGQVDARWGATGTVAYLRDPDGRLIATYRVP